MLPRNNQKKEMYCLCLCYLLGLQEVISLLEASLSCMQRGASEGPHPKNRAPSLPFTDPVFGEWLLLLLLTTVLAMDGMKSARCPSNYLLCSSGNAMGIPEGMAHSKEDHRETAQMPLPLRIVPAVGLWFSISFQLSALPKILAPQGSLALGPNDKSGH